MNTISTVEVYDAGLVIVNLVIRFIAITDLRKIWQ